MPQIAQRYSVRGPGHRCVRGVLATAVTLAVLWLAARYTNLPSVFLLATGANLPILLAAILVYWLNYLTRSVRFHLLLPGSRFDFYMFRAVSLHGLAAYMVPFRLGELTFPWFIRRNHGGTSVDALKALVAARIMDVALLSILFGCVLILSRNRLVTICEQFGCADWVTLGILQYAGYAGVAIILLCLAAIPVLARFGYGMAMPWARMALASTCIWALVGVFYTLLGVSVGVSLGPPEVIVLLLILAFGQVLPVQGFGSAGVHEVAWITVLLLQGFDMGESVLVALSVHVLVVICVSSLGALWWINPEKARGGRTG